MNAPALSEHPQRDFERLDSSSERLRFLLQYATLAPSSHNTQPWLWQIEGDEIELTADRSREMSALDPDGRELIMSCGAALHHLRLATRAMGYGALVQTFPDADKPDLLVRVRLGSPRPATEKDDLLFGFVTKRHTHRGEFEPRALSSALLLKLQNEAEFEGAELHFARDSEEKREIIALIEQGDLVQQSNAAVRGDMADWIAPPGGRDDGIPSSALGVGDLLGYLAPLKERLWDRGDSIADKDRDLANNAPVLAVLSSMADGPPAWLGAGQALSAVLLRARSENVWASFFSQPIQFDETWRELRHLVGKEFFPQLIFRLGHATPVPATPRRPVDEIATLIPSDLD